MPDKARYHSIMQGYAKKGANSLSEITHNNDFSVLSVSTIVPDENDSFLSLLVRIIGDVAIIAIDQEAAG